MCGRVASVPRRMASLPALSALFNECELRDRSALRGDSGPDRSFWPEPLRTKRLSTITLARITILLDITYKYKQGGGEVDNFTGLSQRKQTPRIAHESSTRYFFLVVTVVTSMTVVPKPSSPVSVVRWEQVEQRFPVSASYGGAEPESLEDEDGCEAKSSTLTGISSQILHDSSLPLSITWT